MNTILEVYYADNAKRLREMADRIIYSLGMSGLADYAEFYSLSNEVFVDVLEKYDESQSFDTFLYSCLANKFKTWMTKSNRYKRKNILKIECEDECGNVSVIEQIIHDDSLDRQIVSDGGSNGICVTLGELIPDGSDMENEIIERDGQAYSKKMQAYLARLSALQKNVLQLRADGYAPDEIRKKLNLNETQYTDCDAAIHSYRNVSVLF